MKRRLFFIEAGKAFPIVAGALYFIRCGSSMTGASGVADIQSQSNVVNGHSHTTNVPASDQLHPADMTYATSTAAAHNHEVILLSADLQNIAAGGSVTVASTVAVETGIHTHNFTFTGKK